MKRKWFLFLIENAIVESGDRTTSILAQWRHYPRLKMCVEMQVYRPQESAWKPPLPQYATTLHASGGQRSENILND
jgi:hypothetical protein